MATWYDDLFGRHRYGVVFPSDAMVHDLERHDGHEDWGIRARMIAYNPEKIDLETDDTTLEGMDKIAEEGVYRWKAYMGGSLREAKRALDRSTFYLALAGIVIVTHITLDIWLGEAFPQMHDDWLDTAFLLAMVAMWWWAARSDKFLGRYQGFQKCIKFSVMEAKARGVDIPEIPPDGE